jgi:hypothetical protein
MFVPWIAVPACSPQQMHKQMREAVMNENGVKLRGSVAVTPRNLQASYEIENRSGADIYILDALFQLAAQPVVDPSLAYTVIEGDLLTLFRGFLRIPEGLQVEAPDIPFARLLPAGGILKGIIDAPLPLRFHHPYEWPDKPEIRPTHKVRLRVGYVAAKELNPRPVAKRVGAAELYYLSYRQVIDVQSFLETPEQEATVPILVKP